MGSGEIDSRGTGEHGLSQVNNQGCEGGAGRHFPDSTTRNSFFFSRSMPSVRARRGCLVGRLAEPNRNL